MEYVEQYVGVDWAGSIFDTKADIAADLNKTLPIESEVADTIVSLSVMEHLCEPQTVLNEAYRILNEGRCIILHVPWQWWVHEAHPMIIFVTHPMGFHTCLRKLVSKK